MSETVSVPTVGYLLEVGPHSAIATGLSARTHPEAY